MDELTDQEIEELARLIKEGFTSGRLDSDDGTRIAWELKWNKFTD